MPAPGCGSAGDGPCRLNVTAVPVPSQRPCPRVSHYVRGCANRSRGASGSRGAENDSCRNAKGTIFKTPLAPSPALPAASAGPCGRSGAGTRGEIPVATPPRPRRDKGREASSSALLPCTFPPPPGLPASPVPLLTPQSSSPSPPVTLGRSLPPPARGLPLFLRARGRTDLQGAVRTLPGHPAHREPRGSALEKPCALPQRLLAARRRHDTAPPPFGSTDEPGPGPAPPARRCGGNLRALFCLLPFQREGGSSPVALLLLFPRDAPQPPHSSINGRLLSYMLTTG